MLAGGANQSFGEGRGSLRSSVAASVLCGLSLKSDAFRIVGLQCHCVDS